MKKTSQMKKWDSDFGKEYTERNIFSPEAMEELYLERFAIKRSEMNKDFLEDINLKDELILEVGCNVGDQLNMLQYLGYRKLYGIELQGYAVERSKGLTKQINIIQGIADDIPFKDNFFEMVFTSGVLIHIAPENINAVIDEIYRCSNKYIWGFEYYADQYTEIPYRGNTNLLWKTDFAKLYIDRHNDLELVKEKRYKYVNENNVDSMFLLKKK